MPDRSAPLSGKFPLELTMHSTASKPWGFGDKNHNCKEARDCKTLHGMADNEERCALGYAGLTTSLITLCASSSAIWPILAPRPAVERHRYPVGRSGSLGRRFGWDGPLSTCTYCPAIETVCSLLSGGGYDQNAADAASKGDSDGTPAAASASACHVVGSNATVSLERQGVRLRAAVISANADADRCVLSVSAAREPLPK